MSVSCESEFTFFLYRCAAYRFDFLRRFSFMKSRANLFYHSFWMRLIHNRMLLICSKLTGKSIFFFRYSFLLKKIWQTILKYQKLQFFFEKHAKNQSSHRKWNERRTKGKNIIFWNTLLRHSQFIYGLLYPAINSMTILLK